MCFRFMFFQPKTPACADHRRTESSKPLFLICGKTTSMKLLVEDEKENEIADAGRIDSHRAWCRLHGSWENTPKHSREKRWAMHGEQSA
jgi:hypothetical protein